VGDWGGGRGAGSGHRGSRSGPASARGHPQLPGRRPFPVLAGAGRAGAAAVHRGEQQRGAAVQPRPAAVGLRVGETGEQLLRVRHRQRRREHRRLRPRAAQHPRLPDTPVRSAGGAGGVGAVREGARRGAGAAQGLPPGLRRQRLRHELRLAQRSGGAVAQPGRPARRLPAQHRRGRRLRLPPQGRRADLADRHGLLRLPRRPRPVRPGAAQGRRRRGAGPRDRGEAQPGRQARSRWHAPRRQGVRGDRCCPRSAAGEGLRQPVPARRVRRRGQHARLRRAARRGDGATGRDQVRSRGGGVLVRAVRADG
jgi:hypothetical protein